MHTIINHTDRSVAEHREPGLRQPQEVRGQHLKGSERAVKGQGKGSEKAVEGQGKGSGKCRTAPPAAVLALGGGGVSSSNSALSAGFITGGPLHSLEF